MNKTKQILTAFKFYTSALTIHEIDSPFLSEFIKNTWLDNSPNEVEKLIERERTKLLNNFSEIELTDLGAGSRSTKGAKKKKISTIAKSALSPPSQLRHLHRIVKYIKAKSILELGTSLGISTAYLASTEGVEVVGMEGDPAVCKIAKDVWARLSMDNIQMLKGDILALLKRSDLPSFNFVFMDGNHRLKATQDYFNLLLPLLNKDAVIIVDDIYWSIEMIEAWDWLIAQKEVKHSLNFYYYGILFMADMGEDSQHLNLVPSVLKPWRRLSLSRN